MESQFLSLAQQAIVLTVVIAAPPILAALVIGLGLAVLQALTQIQEQTAQTVGRIVGVFAMLFFFGAWMSSQLYAYARLIFDNFGTWVK